MARCHHVTEIWCCSMPVNLLLTIEGYYASLHCSVQPIATIIAKSKMLPQRNIAHTVSVTGRVLRCEVSKVIPIAAAMKLTISSRLIAKRIERCIIGITLYRLGSISIVVHQIASGRLT